jgi:hypothetical protein
VLARDVGESGLRGCMSSRCGGPLQQVAAADRHAVERARDRIGGHQGLLQQLGQVPEPTPQRAGQVGPGLAIEMAFGEVVAARRETRHCTHQRPGRKRRQHQHQRSPG